MAFHKKKGPIANINLVEDYDEIFGKMEDRAVVQAGFDANAVADMRAATKIRQTAGQQKRQDPAMIKRAWQFHLAVTGIENCTGTKQHVFVALSMKKNIGNRKEVKWKTTFGDFSYTRSYSVASNTKKVFSAGEQVYATVIKDHNYYDLQKHEVLIDLWEVFTGSFNQMLGTGKKSLYDIGNTSVYQHICLKPDDDKNAFDIGVVYVNAMCDELFGFMITANNWQFNARQELSDIKKSKRLRIEVPKGTDRPVTTFETFLCQGPRYYWPICSPAGDGFQYVGTKAALYADALTVSVLSDGKLQGKAVITLSSLEDLPIATGTVKALSDNAEMFIQGQVGGSICLQTKASTEKKFVDGPEELPSIPSPLMPPVSLALFHLQPKLQYLVVELRGADGLPAASPDSGTSNPFARVRYDCVVQQSEVCWDTLRPVWNQTLFMPVRLCDEKLRTVYMKDLLPKEIASKGFLEFEVWHWENGCPTDFLGGHKLDLSVLKMGEPQKKSICEACVKAKKLAQAKDVSDSQNDKGPKIGNSDSEDEENQHGEDFCGVSAAFVKKQETRVYQGVKEKVSGSWLPTPLKATISYNAYFIPDFPLKFQFPEQPESANFAALFKDAFKRWEETWPGLNETYGRWFPDAPTGRRYPCRYSGTHGELIPLPSLIISLALPASLQDPQVVGHWVRCMEFSVPAKQVAAREITAWQVPDLTLSLRRGSVQDHAVVLCCALLGLKKDAFVCKGTVQGGDHAWVMTRETGGVVTFWETTTLAKFHLPRRWSGDHSLTNTQITCQKRYKEAASTFLPGWIESAPGRAKYSRKQLVSSMGDLTRLPIAPMKELCSDENLVPVPYESIEVVFNNRQVWGNTGNHHPSCINYDMEADTPMWRPFMTEDESKAAAGASGKTVAIAVGPKMLPASVKTMEDNIEAEIKESIRMTRIRSGHDTLFEDNEVLQEVLVQYLDLLELEITLEVDWAIDEDGNQIKPPGKSSPFNGKEYVEQSKAKWTNYWKDKKTLDVGKTCVPVKRNCHLSGVPLHVSSTDLRELRYQVLEAMPVQEYIGLQNDDVQYFVCCKVYPLPNTVASVWVYVGVQVPLNSVQVARIVTEQAKADNTHKISARDRSAARAQGYAVSSSSDDDSDDDKKGEDGKGGKGSKDIKGIAEPAGKAAGKAKAKAKRVQRPDAATLDKYGDVLTDSEEDY